VRPSGGSWRTTRATAACDALSSVVLHERRVSERGVLLALCAERREARGHDFRRTAPPNHQIFHRTFAWLAIHCRSEISRTFRLAPSLGRRRHALERTSSDTSRPIRRHRPRDGFLIRYGGGGRSKKPAPSHVDRSDNRKQTYLLPPLPRPRLGPTSRMRQVRRDPINPIKQIRPGAHVVRRRSWAGCFTA